MPNKDRKRNLCIGVGAGVALSAGLGYLAYRKYSSLKEESDFLFLGDNKTVDFSQEIFEDVSVVAYASNILVDLSGAIADENPMTLYLKGTASNLDVIVPEGWNVKLQGRARAASQVENDTDFDYDDIKAPLLFIDYDLKGANFNIFYSFDDLEEEEEEDGVEELLEEVIVDSEEEEESET